MDELLIDFLAESADQLESIGAELARLARDPSRAVISDALSRRLHALAGSGGLLDFPRLERVARAAETLVDRLRASVAPAPAAIELALATVGRMRTLLAGIASGAGEPAGDDSELIARIERVDRGIEAAPAASDRGAYLTVRALNETFALPIAFARSGVRIETLTRLPSAPPHVIGFANLGGSVLEVVCLARRLDPNARPPGSGALAVVIATAAQTFALAVQDFGDIVEAGEADIMPTHGESRSAALSSRALRSGTLFAPILDPEIVFDSRARGGLAVSRSQPH